LLQSSVAQIRLPSLLSQLQLAQSNVSLHIVGLHLDASLFWTTHINIIVSKASKRLYFLKQLKRAGVPPHQLLHFYTAVIRPVLEYASPVWHYSITRAQSYQLESIQKRAVHIIFSDTRGMSYPNVLFVANSLTDKQDKLSRCVFKNICKPNSCLYHLLPPPRDTNFGHFHTTFFHISPRPISQTKQFQSFLNFAVNNYQSPL